MRNRLWLLAPLAVLALCPVGVLVSGLLVYNLPPLNERLAWRIDNLRAQIRYAFNPPEQTVFIPQEQQDMLATAVEATLQAFFTPTPLFIPPTGPASPIPLSPTPLPPTATPTLTPTPIPEKVILDGIVHEYQKFNNCGPANLSMALSFWGWEGDQFVTRAYLRPSYEIDDKNVNPFEMVDFVETQTEYKALTRVAGDLDLLKRFVAAGFPVIIEKGLQKPNEYWLGHYQVISGYDDPKSHFIVYDSFIGPDYGYPVPYQEIAYYWQHFNNIYVVIYPPEREAELLFILGPHADPTYNYQFAAQKARGETASMSGADLYFAWFNLGSNLVALGDYTGAAQAYDAAFAVYATLPQEQRPWRMLWYQIGPYPAYYHTDRYQDVIDLARNTLIHLDKPVLEETYYWRGLAREALGDRNGAIEDLQRAASLNPRSTDAIAQLGRLGVENP